MSRATHKRVMLHINRSILVVFCTAFYLTTSRGELVLRDTLIIAPPPPQGGIFPSPRGYFLGVIRSQEAEGTDSTKRQVLKLI